MNLDERIRLCIEHWSNTFKAIEEDKKLVRNYARIKFEDLLRDPNGELKKVCGFLGIGYDDDMTPQWRIISCRSGPNTRTGGIQFAKT